MSARRLPIHIFTIYLHFNMMSIQTVRAWQASSWPGPWNRPSIRLAVVRFG